MIGWGTATLGNPSMKKCAFCKYWYDPTCEMIAPSTAGRWYFCLRDEIFITEAFLFIVKSGFRTYNKATERQMNDLAKELVLCIILLELTKRLPIPRSRRA